MMVDFLANTASTIFSSTCGQMEALGCSPEAGPRSWAEASAGNCVMSSTGTVTASFQFLLLAGATMVTGAVPPRNRATVECGSTVAERPIR